MIPTASSPVTQKPPSIQMCAVLIILSADADFEKAVLPHIEFATESIFWERIFSHPFGSGHRAALRFAYSIWADEVMAGSNPFSDCLNMDAPLKRACLNALALRWGVRR
jgi:hypothetical protein